MTDRENMPPLPAEIEPTEQCIRDARNTVREAFRHYRETMGLSIDDVRSFTADQLRAYGQACWSAAIEAAAKKCADVPIDHVFTTTIDACASAIRSMKEPE